MKSNLNYIGSKLSLLEFIEDTIINNIDEKLEKLIFCDIFAGTGIVGRYFKNKTKKVISNDFEYYSYVLLRHYIDNSEDIPRKDALIEKLNNLPLRKNGFVFENYSDGGKADRKYYTRENGQKIDTIRSKIEQWKKEKYINEKEYYFLLSSIIESSDKIANTAVVYGAFLKEFKKKSKEPLILRPSEIDISKNTHEAYHKDSNELIKEVKGDILYLDPPYNNRQYGANYHLLNTIALYDEFEPNGKTGLRDYQRSDYCVKKTVNDSFEELIANANFKYIFLSYNNEGLMTEEEVREIMKKYGTYEVFKKKYQRFKADSRRKHKADSTFEYLHFLNKN